MFPTICLPAIALAWLLPVEWADLWRLPECWNADQLQMNYRWRRRCEEMSVLYPEDQLKWDLAYRRAYWAYSCNDALDDARRWDSANWGGWFSLDQDFYRLSRLARLRELLGPKLWFEGRLPSPTP